MTKLCRALFKCENKLKLVEKIMCKFVVHSNDSACRKSGRLGLEQVCKGTYIRWWINHLVNIKIYKVRTQPHYKAGTK